MLDVVRLEQRQTPAAREVVLGPCAAIGMATDGEPEDLLVEAPRPLRSLDRTSRQSRAIASGTNALHRANPHHTIELRIVRLVADRNRPVRREVVARELRDTID